MRQASVLGCLVRYVERLCCVKWMMDDVDGSARIWKGWRLFGKSKGMIKKLVAANGMLVAGNPGLSD